jgi:hypothetical protein
LTLTSARKEHVFERDNLLVSSCSLFDWNLQFLTEEAHNVIEGEGCIREKEKMGCFPQMLHNAAEKSGLAGANFAGEHDQVFTFAEPIEERGVRPLIDRIGIEDLRVRG